MAKKNDKKKDQKAKTKKSFWKVLGTIAKVGVGVVYVASVTSLIALIPGVGAAAAIGINAVAAAGTFLGIGGLALTGVTALGGAIVKGVKGIFNKKQVKENEQEQTKENEQEQTKENEQEQTKENEQEQTKENQPNVEEENNLNDQKEEVKGEEQTTEISSADYEDFFTDVEPLSSDKEKSQEVSENVNPVEEINDEIPTQTETTTHIKTGGSTKASGLYNSMSEENKHIYDAIVGRTFNGVFGKMTHSQLAEIRKIITEDVQMIKNKNNLDGYTKEDAQTLALYEKLKNVRHKSVEKEGKVMYKDSYAATDALLKKVEITDEDIQKQKTKKTGSR